MMRPASLLLSLWIFGSPALAHASAIAELHQAALIQDRGKPLDGGIVTGSGIVPLERAVGGETPVLSFSTDQGPVRLLLDTGAAAAMVSPELAQRIGLEIHPLPPDAFSLAGGGEGCHTLQPARARLPELRLASATSAGSLRLQGLEALVIPVSALPNGVDGVIGAPSLRQVPFLIDPQSGTVRFGRTAHQWRQAMPFLPEILPLTWQRGVPLLQIRVRTVPGGTIRLHQALADTGAEGLFLTSALAATLTPLGGSQPVRLVGVCGEQQVHRQRFTGVGLGPHAPPVQSVEAILTRNPVFSLLGVEAIVGQELLSTRRQLWRLDASPPRLELW